MTTITIITPTYNRAHLLGNLYQSLRAQQLFNFNWLIVDDGGTDNTKEIVRAFKQDLFKIKYVYQENAGKHIALNKAFSILTTDLALIVDSDDILSNDAIKTINQKWKKYQDNQKICGLVFRRANQNGNIIGPNFPQPETIANYNDYVINQGIAGDKAEVFRSSVLNNYHYPQFHGEKFLGEGVLWSQIADKYDMVFINKPIYIGEYLEGGLTQRGRALRIKCPKGGMYHAEEYLDKKYSLKIRIKNGILYLTYARFDKAKLSRMIKTSNHKTLLVFCALPSMLLYILWSRHKRSIK